MGGEPIPYVWKKPFFDENCLSDFAQRKRGVVNQTSAFSM